MEPRYETPRRLRTKRRNEPRELDITRIETDKSGLRRRRIRRGDYEKRQVEEEAVESSDDESDDEGEAETPPGSPTTTASPAAPPPGTATLSPPPPPPPVDAPPSATETPGPASTTLDPQTIISAAPTVDTQPLESSTVPATSQPVINGTPIAAGETTEPPRSQNGVAPSRQQSTGVPGAIIAVIVIFGTLACLAAFLLFRLYRRRRGRDEQEPDQSFGKDSFGSGGPKSDIRIMDEAMAAAYKLEDGGNSGIIPARDYDASRYETADNQGVSRWSDSTPGWLRRQVAKVKKSTTTSPAAEEDDSSPNKNAAVSRWMNQHTSRMLDPTMARASVASSGAASLRGLGPVPSVSPASVVGDPRESILSEMGQIRRAAVPPPLDPKLVQRVQQMREEEQQMREQQEQQTRGSAGMNGGVQEGALLQPPPPIADRWGDSMNSPTAMSQAQTESTWNTWGVEQRRK